MAVASEIMSENLLTLREDMMVDEAINLLVSRGFSEAPVLRDGAMVGILSELELFDVLFEPTLRETKVSELMVTDVIAVDESEPLSNVAHLFVLHRIRRLPVLRGGTPVGIVSRRDLLRFASQHQESLVDPLADLMPCLDEE